MENFEKSNFLLEKNDTIINSSILPSLFKKESVASVVNTIEMMKILDTNSRFRVLLEETESINHHFRICENKVRGK